ncbi:hypothetical protein [Micromonospora sp. NPDC049679]|uniref:hypothetical protein n=1 Tax=Micromonospora sp. NPDC049679 TaxID=3155920 RepID=UPI00340B4FAC
MIAAIFAATARHRRFILVVGVVMSAGYGVARWLMPSLGRQLFPFQGVVVLVFALLALIGWVRQRPAAFVVQQRVPSFNAPASGAAVYHALFLFGLFVQQVELLVRMIHSRHLWWPFSFTGVLGLVLVGLLVAGAWRGLGVQLRPDGLRDRDVLGSFPVPWDALPVAHPPTHNNKTTLRLRYARPELVRRRGLSLSRSLLRADNIDARFLAAAIRHYVTHPEHRTAIGTEAEYHRLLHALAETTGTRDDNAG